MKNHLKAFCFFIFIFKISNLNAMSQPSSSIWLDKKKLLVDAVLTIKDRRLGNLLFDRFRYNYLTTFEDLIKHIDGSMATDESSSSLEKRKFTYEETVFLKSRNFHLGFIKYQANAARGILEKIENPKEIIIESVISNLRKDDSSGNALLELVIFRT